MFNEDPYSIVGFVAHLKGLTSHTGYHFRIGAQNSFGTGYGEDHIFATHLNDLLPTTIDLDPDSVTSKSVRLRGLCNPNGSKTGFTFEWSESPSGSYYGLGWQILDDDTVFAFYMHHGFVQVRVKCLTHSFDRG